MNYLTIWSVYCTKIGYVLRKDSLVREDAQGWGRRTRGPNDQHILEEAKMRRKNVAMVLVDFRMDNDMVPQTWMVLSENIQNIRKTTKSQTSRMP